MGGSLLDWAGDCAHTLSSLLRKVSSRQDTKEKKTTSKGFLVLYDLLRLLNPDM